MMYTLKDILRIEVAPALGCTEPVAVALCASAAKSLIASEDLTQIELWIDANIYKNGMAVAIPGAKGAYGIDLAAALGAIAGKPELKLEVLDPVDEHGLKRALDFLEQKRVKVHVLEKRAEIYIRCKVYGENTSAESVIEVLHDNITSLKINDKSLKKHALLNPLKFEDSALAKLETWLKQQDLERLIALLDTMDDEDMQFIKEGLAHNIKLADHGLLYGNGLGVGKTLERLSVEGLVKRDMILAARILTSAAADARMSGVKLPAMSSAGSGNHGLIAILPIWAVKDYLQINDEVKIFKAMALSHVITAYIKAFTGRLSALCGCSIAAGAGATAGITYLMDGTITHIAGAIKNLIEDLAGVICDGAKNSCALKLATAAGTSVQSALFSLHGINVNASDGIIATTPEKTMQNVGKLSTDGMIETDRTILQIMMDKQFSENPGE
jgi:L-cysteine desulfidase